MNFFNNNNNNINSNTEITLKFAFTGAQVFMVKANLNEKVSEIIKRYRNKASDFEDNRKFIFNAKDLNPTLTVSETGLLNNDNIFVVTTKKNNYDTNNIKY